MGSLYWLVLLVTIFVTSVESQECPACKSEKGQCVGEGRIWKDRVDCVTFRCKKINSEFKLDPIKHECPNPRRDLSPREYRCIGVGRYRITKESNKCIYHKCISEDGTVKIQRTDMCLASDGSCRKNGRIWKNRKTCVTFKCGQSANWIIVKQECPNPLYTKGSKQYKCIGENKKRTLQENCSRYTCKSETVDGVKRMKTEHTFWGCRYNGKCIKDDDTLRSEPECVTRQCDVQQLNATHYQASMKIIQQDCPYKEGECVKKGETRNEENCSVKKCSVNEDTHSTIMDLDKLMCKDNINGTCHENGSKMPYKHAGAMLSCDCKINGNTASIDGCTFSP